MAHYGEQFVDPPVIPVAEGKIAGIWKIAGILAIITIIEYIFAFSWGEKTKVLITIYILLTLLKAYFIMAEFMHLGHEKKALQLSVLLPLVFIAWGVVGMLQEADTIGHMVNTWYNFLK